MATKCAGRIAAIPGDCKSPAQWAADLQSAAIAAMRPAHIPTVAFYQFFDFIQ